MFVYRFGFYLAYLAADMEVDATFPLGTLGTDMASRNLVATVAEMIGTYYIDGYPTMYILE